MGIKLLISILWLTSVLADQSNTATKIVLGGEWFTSTNTGESNGYLMTDFKEKVFEPIMKRVAQHVYDNYSMVVLLEWLVGLIGAWLTIISIILGYLYKNCSCKTGPVVEGRRESYRPPMGL